MPQSEPTPVAEATTPSATWRYSPWFLVAMLTAVNAVNWADRSVVPILVPAIAEEFGFTDTQLGLIGSVAFALIYAVASFFFGYAADRRIRRNLIAFGLITWCLATAASGAAWSFGSLFAARFFTGIGEASLYPAGMSLIAERFPVASRGKAMGIFGAAAAVGGGLGIGLGGTLTEMFGWRTVFITYGIGGLLLVPLVLSVPESPRPQPTGRDADTLGVLTGLIRDVRLISVWLAGMVMIAAGLGYAFWVPTYFVRLRDMSLGDAGIFFGVAQIVGGLGGSILGGVLADRRRRRRFAGELDVSIVAALVAAPLALATLNLTWPPAIFVAGVLTPLAIFAFFPSIQTVIVEIVPPRQHGLAYAINILFLGGFGSAAGPTLVGLISDRTGSLATAMQLPIVGMVLASLMMAFATRLIRRREATSSEQA